MSSDMGINTVGNHEIHTQLGVYPLLLHTKCLDKKCFSTVLQTDENKSCRDRASNYLLIYLRTVRARERRDKRTS